MIYLLILITFFLKEISRYLALSISISVPGRVFSKVKSLKTQIKLGANSFRTDSFSSTALLNIKLNNI
jgi:hypothetical protein